MTKKAWLCAMVALAFLTSGVWAQESGGEGDPYVLTTISEVNGTLRAEWMDLRAEWMDLRVEQIEMLTLNGRSTSRLHRQPFRWVPGDWRRAADGNKLTWLLDLSDGLGPTGLTPVGVELAVDRAMATWSADSCMSRVPMVKRMAGSSDPDIFDAAFGYGGLGDYRTADIVHAGWFPPEFFDRVAGPGSGETVVALSVTFIYVERSTGRPTDFDRDNHLDTAHSEIYYNQGFSWLPGTANAMDVETVALHEIGHALGIGHIGPPLTAIMNPIYAGARTSLEPLDHAALCSVWASWPK